MRSIGGWSTALRFEYDVVWRTLDTTLRTLKLTARRIANSPVALAGRRYECPCCGGTFRRLRPGGQNGRPNTSCPRCGSLERHRAMGRFLREWLPRARPRDILHFAPERSIRPLLAGRPGVRYVGADLDPIPGDLEVDITAIPFDGESFDLVVCSHVLEHVPDDIGAMREIRRVLHRDGVALLQVPIVYTLSETYEDPSLTDPDERIAHFGQRDHVRLYGPDLETRLSSAGFDVEVTSYGGLDPALRDRYRLEEPWAPDASGADIYRCRPHDAPA